MRFFRLRRLFRRLFINSKSALLFLVFCFSFFDLVNLDAIIYKNLCLFLSLFGYKLICYDFYDVKYWEGAVSLGTILASYFAYQALKKNNESMFAEQKPFVVFYNQISLSAGNKVHGVSLKNIGRGLAHNITLTADPTIIDGKVIDGSNPGTIHLSPNESHSLWALDDTKLIKQLRKRGYKGKDILEMSGKKLNEWQEKGIILYVHYYDSLENEYVTEAKFQQFNHFIKLVSSKYWGAKGN